MSQRRNTSPPTPSSPSRRAAHPGHRDHAKKKPKWLPLAVAALVAGGGVTAYVALGGSGGGSGAEGNNVADGANRVRAADSLHPSSNASEQAKEKKDRPDAAKSAKPSANASKKPDAGRSSRSAKPQRDGVTPSDHADHKDGNPSSRKSRGAHGSSGSGSFDGTGTAGPGTGTDSGANAGSGTGHGGSGDNGQRDSQATKPAARSGETSQVLALVNKEREAAGCKPVMANSTLNQVADTYSGVMADHQNLSHTGPDGSSVGDRVTRSGYTWSRVGENIARGQADASAVMNSWMGSPGHRANILNCSFREMGLGVDQGSGGPWWTQVFATGR